MLDNIGDLSKPVTIFIEKVSNAVGVLYQPTHIKRIARAEVEAEKTRATGALEITEIQQRGLERIIHQEGRKQANIEQITEQAAALLPYDAEVQGLDEDWVAHFFNQCDTVSDKEMQSLWAKLLSGEAAHPGKFSKRTVNFVSTIDKKDAALFTTLCRFNWWFPDISYFGPFIYKPNNGIYAKYGITSGVLLHLQSIGLISFQALGYEQAELKKYTPCQYFGRATTLVFVDDSDRLDVGHVLLTDVGKELAPLWGAEPSEDIYEETINYWYSQGHAIAKSLR